MCLLCFSPVYYTHFSLWFFLCVYTCLPPLLFFYVSVLSAMLLVLFPCCFAAPATTHTPLPLLPTGPLKKKKLFFFSKGPPVPPNRAPVPHAGGVGEAATRTPGSGTMRRIRAIVPKACGRRRVRGVRSPCSGSARTSPDLGIGLVVFAVTECPQPCACAVGSACVRGPRGGHWGKSHLLRKVCIVGWVTKEMIWLLVGVNVHVSTIL
jgi:hypothetical protein